MYFLCLSYYYFSIKLWNFSHNVVLFVFQFINIYLISEFFRGRQISRFFSKLVEYFFSGIIIFPILSFNQNQNLADSQ